MIRQPLFGQDSSPHKTSFFISFVSTAVLWLLFFICAFFIRLTPKSDFKTVQIVLSSDRLDYERESAASSSPELSTPAEQAGLSAVEEALVQNTAPAAQEAAAAVQNPLSRPEEPPAPAKASSSVKTSSSAPAPVQDSPKKPSAESTQTPDNKKFDFSSFEYAKEISDDFDSARQPKKSMGDVDWDSLFGDSPQTQEAVSEVQKVQASSGSEGNAGSVSQSAAQNQQSRSASGRREGGSAAPQTSEALAKIRESSYSSVSGDGTKSVSTIKTSSGGNGTVTVAMSDGSTRVLLQPSSPSIKLSDRAAALIESKRTVKISFRVVESGNVTRNEISITPASVLPQAVRDEIVEQLSQWRFEGADTSSYATFDYTIIKE